MTTFTQKMETEVTLLECDLCGVQQNKYRDPLMADLVYTEVAPGSHGRTYLRDRHYHLCTRCQNRVGEMVQTLRLRRLAADHKLGKLFELLDRLLDET